MLNEKDVLELLAEYDISAVAQDIPKNNGVILRGITIGDGAVRPTLYLQYYTDLQEFIKDAIRAKNNIPDMNDISRLPEWEYIKDKLRVKLSKNPETRLVTYPAFLDLKMTAYIKLADNATVGIGKDMFERYGMAINQFFKKALDNTAEYEGYRLFTMKEMLESMGCEDMGFFDEPDHMHILTNDKKLFGAAALLYSLDHLPEEFFMLPSSIHELILIYPVNDVDPFKLSEIVREVNGTQVEPTEVLSDHAYHYKDGEWLSIP